MTIAESVPAINCVWSDMMKILIIMIVNFFYCLKGDIQLFLHY